MVSAQDLIQRALMDSTSGVGAIGIPVQGYVGADYVGAGYDGLSYEEINTLNDMAEAAGVGAVMPSLMNRFNFFARNNPRFAAAAQRTPPKPVAGRPAIAVSMPGLQSSAPMQAQGVVQQSLNVSGPTDLPINSVAVAAGATLLIQIRPNFPIRGTGLVISEDSRAAFAVSGLSIGGMSVFAGAGEVNADIYSQDSTWRTLFPSLDTSQTLDITLRNRSGAPIAFNAVLKGEAARPGF